MRKLIMMTAAIALIAVGCATSDTVKGYSDKKIDEVTSVIESAPIPYRMYLPLNMDPDNPARDGQLPLCIYLHDKQSPTTEGLDKLLAYVDSEQVPAMVIAPICPSTSDWTDNDILSFLHEIISALSDSWLIDPNRVYLTGFGSGGLGTWHYALEYPKSLSTIAPVCGGVSVNKTTPIPTVNLETCDLNIWVIHYIDDKVVSPDFSKKVMSNVWAKSVGCSRFTEYDQGGHTADIYGNKKFLRWLFNTRRSYAIQ